jgi:hypothetical protein
MVVRQLPRNVRQLPRSVRKLPKNVLQLLSLLDRLCLRRNRRLRFPNRHLYRRFLRRLLRLLWNNLQLCLSQKPRICGR